MRLIQTPRESHAVRGLSRVLKGLGASTTAAPTAVRCCRYLRYSFLTYALLLVARLQRVMRCEVRDESLMVLIARIAYLLANAVSATTDGLVPSGGRHLSSAERASVVVLGGSGQR